MAASKQQRRNKPYRQSKRPKQQDAPDLILDITTMVDESSQPTKSPPITPAHEAPSADAAPILPFYLMGLPPELRLEIAEFSLKFEERLTWTWTDWLLEERSGTFLGLMALLPLTQTSPPLYDETRKVVWRINTFSFNPDCFRDNSPCYIGSKSMYESIRPSMFPYLVNAFMFFLQHAPIYVIENIHHLEFTDSQHLLQDLGQRATLTNLAERTPNPDVHVIFREWFANGWFNNRKFLTVGDKIGIDLQLFNGSRDKRTWRIFPRVDDSEYEPHRREKMKRVLGSETYDKVADWMDNGI